MRFPAIRKLSKAALLLGLAVSAPAQQRTDQKPQPKGDLIGPESRIIAPPANYQFPSDKFVYTAEWRIWNAGTVTLQMAPTGSEMRVLATADSMGAVSLLYPVHDKFQALFDPHTFCSVSLHKHSEEGLRARDTLISYNYARKKSVLDETNLKNNQFKHQENDIPGCVTDVISGLFYLGSLPLTVGSVYTLPVNDGGLTVDVRARVEARETIKVPAGTFQTVRVSPEAVTGPLKQRGKIWIWYTDDARHTIVQMRGRMFWGTITFALQRTEKK